ncbi:MAG: hypothetical protein S4CHLAM7_12820 [Chlamydiae bacterium]|nr:hypothetical protein [Chlamydiota bacterium]
MTLSPTSLLPMTSLTVRERVNYYQDREEQINPLDYVSSDRKTHTVLPKGFHVLKIRADGNVFNFSQPALLEIIQDVYIKVINDETVFSIDGENWSDLQDLFSLACNFDLPVTEDNQPLKLNLDFEINAMN